MAGRPLTRLRNAAKRKNAPKKPKRKLAPSRWGRRTNTRIVHLAESASGWGKPFCGLRTGTYSSTGDAAHVTCAKCKAKYKDVIGPWPTKRNPTKSTRRKRSAEAARKLVARTFYGTEPRKGKVWARRVKKAARKAKQSKGTYAKQTPRLGTRRKNPGEVNDRRSDRSKPWGFVVFTDSFMSGWGGAARGRSLYALAVHSPREANVVLANGKKRGEMKCGRLVDSTARGLPKVKLGAHDHLSITDRSNASRWYTPGGF